MLQPENLAWIHDVFRVKRTLDAAHHVNGTGAGLCKQKIHFVQSDAMLAGARAFQTQRARDQGMIQLFCHFTFFGFAGVDQIAEVEVAVADMTDQEVGDATGVCFDHGI